MCGGPRESCIVSLKILLKRSEKTIQKTVHYTPDCSTDAQWWEQVKSYHVRQKKNKLPAAECCLVQVDDLEAVQLDPTHAPVFTPINWGEEPMNLPGIDLDAAKADWFCQQIARGR